MTPEAAMKTPTTSTRWRTHSAGDHSGDPGGGAPTGQVLVMFALFLTGMLGMLGLATDLGMSFAERRSMQNAADAGALAGARVVVKTTTSAPLSAQSEVQTVTSANKMSLGTITGTICTYINDAGTSLGSCSSTVPSAATGVRVTVQEQHPTFFIRAVPGAPDTVDTGATATANVKKLAPPRDGPFLPCAINTQPADGLPQTDLMVQQSGSWVLNPSAIGRTFKIHGPQIEKCDAKASRYKGLADTDANKNKNTPNWFNYKEGDSAGLISVDVEGPDGCKAGQEVVNCVAFLPIVINNPPESGNNRELWAITFAPFYITAPKSNEHYGKLVANYMVYGSGDNGSFGWYQGYTGPIAIRLTG